MVKYCDWSHSDSRTLTGNNKKQHNRSIHVLTFDPNTQQCTYFVSGHLAQNLPCSGHSSTDHCAILGHASSQIIAQTIYKPDVDTPRTVNIIHKIPAKSGDAINTRTWGSFLREKNHNARVQINYCRAWCMNTSRSATRNGFTPARAVHVRKITPSDINLFVILTLNAN